MDIWSDFTRNEIRQLISGHARRSGTPHREVWHLLYDAYAEQGGTVPEAKNKLQAFDCTALERLLKVAKTL